MKPFTLTVANGLTSVPSPLKWMLSTMAFGTATPPTMFHPCALKMYDPRSVCRLQPGEAACARATPGVLNVIAAMRLTNTHAKNEQLVILLINFVFMSLISFYLSFLVLAFFDSSLLPPSSTHSRGYGRAKELSFLAVH